MDSIILVGGGGHCISAIDVIEKTGLYQIQGILDIPDKVGQKILDYHVIGTDEDIAKYSKKEYLFLITVGQIASSDLRKNIYYKIKKAGGTIPVIVSPLAYVSKYAKIGEGTIIMHGSIVNASASIGICSILNTQSLIEHEATIGNFCHISTASIINGQAIIGDQCFVGSNTVVANNISIISNSIISAGSQVLRNINEPGTYIGQPLRKIH